MEQQAKQAFDEIFSLDENAFINMKKYTPPENPSIDISFGENLHAEAIYSMDSDTGIPHLISLMADIGKDGSSVDLIDDLSENSIWKARLALQYVLNDATEERALDIALTNEGRREQSK